MRHFNFSTHLLAGLLCLVLPVAVNAQAGKTKPAQAEKVAATPDANKLMAAAEHIRNPSETYATDVFLEDQVKGKTTKSRYETYCKGRDKALVKFMEPAVDVGTRVLFVDNDMWIYIPTTAKPVRVSPRQKLAGNAAYGDVTRLNFVGNYTAEYLRADTYEKRAAHVLDLTAIKDRPVTYDKIEYWIDKENNRPLRMLYKTMTGKIVRESYFDDYKSLFGVMRPNKFIIVDALDKSHVTTLVFKNTKQRQFADVIFQKQNLGRE